MYNYSNFGTGLYNRTNTNLYGERPLNHARTHERTSTQKIKESQKKKALKTAAVIAGTAILAYKGAPVINKVATSAGIAIRKAGTKVAKYFPNLAKAGEYFMKACKAPLKPIDKLVNILTKNKK